MYQVAIFNEVFEKITNFEKQIVGDCDVDDQLLAAPPLIYTINHKDVAMSVAIKS